jgi:hypothetical protein
MPPSRLALLAILAASLAGPSTAQTLRERMQQGLGKAQQGAEALGRGVQQGAEAAREGASAVADQIEQNVESSVDLMTDEDSVEATRAELDGMVIDTLDRLFAETPGARALYEESAGYAVFDTRKLTLAGLTAGTGRGVAISREDDRRIYMKMGTAGVSLAFGLGGFETQIVVLLKDKWDFEAFVTQGYDATADAGTMLGDKTSNLNMHFVDGRAFFVLTQQGWKISATAAGTKYWPDRSLNAAGP